MAKKSLSDQRANVLTWLFIILAGAWAYLWETEGQNTALGFLWWCWGLFVTWVGVTAFILCIIILAAILGGPLTWWKK